MKNKHHLGAIYSMSILIGCSVSIVHAAGAGAGGRDVLHVPMAWCGMQGSPAVVSPNILSVGATTPDTSTDAVLWRRHERPTDNILIPQADITLRSAINDAWGTLNFPLINDTSTALGLQGDVRGEVSSQLGTGSEFAQAILDCDSAWVALSRGGIGITAININLFHDGSGDYIFLDALGNPTGGTPIGWGGCVRPVGSNICSAPYDGRIMVVDNNYLYPTVVNRNIPASPNEPSGGFVYGATDPFDQLVGHEVGHAMGLDHTASGATNSTSLMFPTSTDNDSDGQVDNISLTGVEVANLRATALLVPGLEIDPPGRVDPGNMVAMTLVDVKDEKVKLPPHQDLASLKITLNKASDLLYLSARVKGITPKKQKVGATFWFALDTGKPANARPELLKELGFPFTDFNQADVLIQARVEQNKLTGNAWRIDNGQLSVIDQTRFELRRLSMYPYYAPIEGQSFPFRFVDKIAGIYDEITVMLPARQAGVTLAQAFNVRLSMTAQGVFDELNGKVNQINRFILEDANFPSCFARDTGVPGGKVPVDIEGLSHNRPIHALFGPLEVANGTTDGSGNARIDLPIPDDATGGLHLVTVGVDGTAFTADCVVMVKEKGTGGTPDVPNPELIKELLELQNCQCDLVAQLGRLIEKAMENRDDENLKFLQMYRDLVEKHGSRLQYFEKLFHEKGK